MPLGLVEWAWPELQEAPPGCEAHPVTHQTSASRKEAKNKAVVKKGGGVRAQVRLEPRGKSETTGRAAVTHASHASGQWDLIHLWPQLLPGMEEGKQPRRPRPGPHEALLPGKVLSGPLPRAQALDLSWGSRGLGWGHPKLGVRTAWEFPGTLDAIWMWRNVPPPYQELVQ